jgi:hypothetical protein
MNAGYQVRAFLNYALDPCSPVRKRQCCGFQFQGPQSHNMVFSDVCKVFKSLTKKNASPCAVYLNSGSLKSAVSLYLQASAYSKMGKKKSKSKNKAKLAAAAAAATAQTTTTSPLSIDNTTAPLPLFNAESLQCKG